MAPPNIFGGQYIKEQSICLLIIVVCYRYFIDDCAGVGVIVTALRKMERKERLTGRWNWAKKFRPTFLLFHSD
jgi:hypothetical protein